MKSWARVLWIAAALAAILFAFPRTAQALPARAVNAPIKVMPLGDSITSGTDTMASYRCELHKSLVAAGYSVDFVGSVHGQWGTGTSSDHNFTPPSYCDMVDWDEEGHSGWAIYNILSGAPAWPGNLQSWANAAVPDVVLIHLGTVNFINTSPAPNVNAAILQMGEVIDTLRAANPRVKILLAQIIPSLLNSTTINLIPQFNSYLPWLVGIKAKPCSPILLVDMYTGFDQANFYADDGLHTHPNPAGEEWMAARWKTAFDKIMKTTCIFVPSVMN
jgi:hypothetical protein